MEGFSWETKVNVIPNTKNTKFNYLLNFYLQNITGGAHKFSALYKKFNFFLIFFLEKEGVPPF